MASISVTFNGTQTDLDDFCEQHRYQATIDDAPNPETKVQFFQRKVKEFVWESVKARRVIVAADAARDLEQAKTVNF